MSSPHRNDNGMAESHTAENDLEPLNPTHATAESSEGDHAKVEEKSAETGLDINNYMRIALEEPSRSEIRTGMGNLRGWAISSDKIEKVEILIDGAYAFDAPYGGSRQDVGEAFPDIPYSSSSGFSTAYNFSGLSVGQHTVTAVAHNENGMTKQSSVSFEVIKVTPNFGRGNTTMNLDQASCSLVSDKIMITKRESTEFYDLEMMWRAEQGYAIVASNNVAGTSPMESTTLSIRCRQNKRLQTLLA